MGQYGMKYEVYSIIKPVIHVWYVSLLRILFTFKNTLHE